MNKATCRALRERVGLSQSDVAKLAGVTVDSVKNWENPKRPSAYPDDVIEELSRMLSGMRARAEEAADMVADEFAGAKTVTMTYWRTQAEHDALAADGAFFGHVNAQSRLCADMLERRGFEVAFAYPEEPGPAQLANIKHRMDRGR